MVVDSYRVKGDEMRHFSVDFWFSSVEKWSFQRSRMSSGSVGTAVESAARRVPVDVRAGPYRAVLHLHRSF